MRLPYLMLLISTLIVFPSRSSVGQNNTTATNTPPAEATNDALFEHPNLVAWCIVPFDDRERSPQERAGFLTKLGFKRYAYDYRANHIPQFDAEVEAVKAAGIELTAWWFPQTLNDEAKLILDVLKRHQVKTQLWVTGGGNKTKSAEEQKARVIAEANRIRPIAEAAQAIGCRVGLYNHGGWFGEPENQIEVIQALNMPNVGIIYNQHHGHDHVDQFAPLLQKMLPYLWVLNLNGMVPQGDRNNQKIVPIGQGSLDPQLIKIIRESGYRGQIGILNHTQENAEARLRDNLNGLRWVVDQLQGRNSPRPQPTTWKPAPENPQAQRNPQVEALVAGARSSGNVERGAHVFAAATSACLSCHKVGKLGGNVGPDLSQIGAQQTWEQIAESILQPNKQVKPEYVAWNFLLQDGRLIRGYRVRETEQAWVIREIGQTQESSLNKDDIEAMNETGTLMPDGIIASLPESQRRDLVAFMGDLGRSEKMTSARIDALLAQAASHAPARFEYQKAPLDPATWPSATHPVNRDRIYDFYAKEARYFRGVCPTPPLLPEYPGLDGGTQGHWGNQSDVTWTDGRWNQSQLSSIQCGVFRHGKLQIPRAVCFQSGTTEKRFACFDPDNLSFVAVWHGDFLKFSDVRHGFMHGLQMAGTSEELPDVLKTENTSATRSSEQTDPYRGFYRYGDRTLFAYTHDGQEYLDSVWFDGKRWQRTVGPRDSHPDRQMTQGGPAQWPEILETQGKLGQGHPYATDTLTLPFDNPWRSLMFIGDHDFAADGSAYLCTMQGDVWHVTGIDADLQQLRWKRYATGLHQPLGLLVSAGELFVIGRDQITRLHDLNGDDEADYYECFSRAFVTSPAGHDYTCGLVRDREGNFYTASGKQGVIKISPNGQQVTVLATGLRNPDGLGLLPDGSLTVPSSEGDWVPASLIGWIPPSESAEPRYFGHGGPRGGKRPDLPLVYLPRGLDNSSGGQVYVDSDRWGPLKDQLIHLSFGTGSHFLLLRDEVHGEMQGAVVPLAGEFLSGAHRGKFNPKDGQLYVSGMAGWGTYTPDDGCFHRIRYTGEPVQLPVRFHVHRNGVRIQFSNPVDQDIASQTANHFAQSWNYRYSGGYGSSEYSSGHLDLRGHDTLTITAAHVLGDGKSIFLEIPDVQPTNQLHLLIQSNAGLDHDLFATVHTLDDPFTEYPGYTPIEKTVRPHPLDVDLARATRTKRNPFEKSIPEARSVRLETDTNLAFKTRRLVVRANEPIHFTLVNPDVVPHNWALLKPGTLQAVGQQVNQLIADPEAASKQYIPDSQDVLAYTDIVEPYAQTVIYFRAPSTPGRYPFLCTFPGHWMAMNGELIVE